MNNQNENNFCPCCGKHCALTSPDCERGEAFARTGKIPDWESGHYEGMRRRKDRHDGMHRDHPRKSILDSDRYSDMDMDSKLSALFREAGNLSRFHMEDKGSQTRILHILLEEGSMSQKALTDRICIRSGSASEVLGKLEKAGYICRTVSEADRRGMDIALTREGETHARETTRLRNAWISSQFSSLTEAEKETLLEILEKLSRDWQQRPREQHDKPDV